MKAYIALDVGGTSISAAVVSSDGHFIFPVAHYSAYSDSDRITILNNLMRIITDQYLKTKSSDMSIGGIGIGFPGPFDYENGISRIKGIGKYDSLYGVNLKKELTEMLNLGLNLQFRNDADLYCLGECVYGVGKSYHRCMCICIGTGIGSGFFADGKLITDGPDVPQNGWIYRTPYRDGIADEYISATGIRTMMKQYPETSNLRSVKELANAARAGLPQAVEIFREFGDMLCDVVPGYAVDFNAECLILGGEVSRSCDLFDQQLLETLAEKQIKVSPSAAFADNTLLAGALLFE